MIGGLPIVDLIARALAKWGGSELQGSAAGIRVCEWRRRGGGGGGRRGGRAGA